MWFKKKEPSTIKVSQWKMTIQTRKNGEFEVFGDTGDENKPKEFDDFIYAWITESNKDKRVILVYGTNILALERDDISYIRVQKGTREVDKQNFNNRI